MPEPSEPLQEIQCLSSRIVYQNPWMSVREDEILRADGSKGLYGVVQKPDFVVIAPFQDGYLHLVEQYRYPVKRRLWEFPQGSWEERITDPLSLARAELLEETGLSAGSISHVGRLLQGAGYATQGYNVFFATNLQQKEAALEPEEQGLITKAFSLAEVEAMILSGTIQDASTVAAFGLLRLHSLI